MNQGKSEHKDGCCQCDCVVLVRVSINDGNLEIRPGKYRGIQLKEVGNIPKAYELEEMRNGKPHPLKDDSEVVIRGCEKFIAFPCRGEAS